MQIELFPNEDKKTKLGHSKIEYYKASSILNPTTGFMDAYDFTLNPYSGCSFGCTYCYAAFFSRKKDLMDTWGYWVRVKENAVELLKKKRKKTLENKTIYIGSVTDPYMPIERELNITRDILEELAKYHQPRIVIQTRSPIITKDIAVLQKFQVLQVNMTITTDSEKVRKVFEPLCPSNKARLKAIKQLHDAGIQSCITMTPLLPIENAEQFAESLLETGITRFIIQPFKSKGSKFISGTRNAAQELIADMNWNDEKYQEALKIIKDYIPNIGEGKEGFAPI